MRSVVCALGHAGASTGEPVKVRPGQEQAAKWMEQQSLACFNHQGRLVLKSAALSFTTELPCAKRLVPPEDPLKCSLWCLRRRLRESGWRDAKSARHASVTEKHFNPKCDCVEYYAILLTRPLAFVLAFVAAVCFVSSLSVLAPRST